MMFGFPAYCINRKLFACIYEEGAGIRVPEKVAELLVGRKGIVRFQPEGRKSMKEWIQINRKCSEDYRRDQEILNISIDFVSSALKEGERVIFRRFLDTPAPAFRRNRPSDERTWRSFEYN